MAEIMRIIRGIKAGEEALSRRSAADFAAVSEPLKKALLAMFGSPDPQEVVGRIIEEVRRDGDEALLDLTERIDGVRLASVEVPREQIADAYGEVDAEFRSAMVLAAERVRAFHSRQRAALWGAFAELHKGQIVRPLNIVGAYAPGGNACYPSTVLMTAIPAKVAGVEEIILTTPPTKAGSVSPAALVAADMAGVDRVFSIGGAQAIAALALGTESVPRVDKICGPGNIFVVLAKKLLYGTVGIDGLPGPSEVLIIADETADAAYCASDVLSQAEHDAMASAVVVTTSRRLADDIAREVARQLKELPHSEIATSAIKARGRIIVVDDMSQAVMLANLYAPEHLIIMAQDSGSYVDDITNAGCIVIGARATVVLGDYVAGPSHVLPTAGTARFASPLNVMDFIKLTSLLDVSEAVLKALGPAASVIARAEGLEAHARAVDKRLGNNKNG